MLSDFTASDISKANPIKAIMDAKGITGFFTMNICSFSVDSDDFILAQIAGASV